MRTQTSTPLKKKVSNFLNAAAGEKPSGIAADHKPNGGMAKAINLAPLKEKIGHLVGLHRSAKEATTDLAEAIEAVAESSGVLPAAVRKFVTARAGEKFTDRKTECEQLTLLFDEVGG